MDREKLQDVIPIETPYLVFIDPSSVCNLSCKFCPCGGGNKEVWSQDKRTSFLPYTDYRKIIDDLAEFPEKIKTLRLYKEGEPLANRFFPEMIQYARKKDVTGRIDFTTNGTLFTEDLALAVTDAGVDRINISIEALDAEGYWDISGIKLDFDKFYNNLKFLYHHKNGAHIFVKISDCGLGEHKAEEFYNMFSDISDEMAVEHITSVWPEFEITKVDKDGDFDIYGGKMDERNSVDVCPYIFYSICINSDSSVSTCFMDWNHKLIIGNAKDKSIKEIWNGQQLRDMRINHLQGNRCLHEICSNCGQLKFAVLDNIDSYRNELLERIR